MQNFYDLFIKLLNEMHNAEQQLVEFMPKLGAAITSSNFKEAVHKHYDETKHQVKRLDEIGNELNEDLKGIKNDAMTGLIKEAAKIMKANYDPMVKDAALIAVLQQIEHYEIASYGILKSYARHFKYDRIEQLLKETSEEEGAANKKLIQIAEGKLFSSGVNDKACKRVA